MHHEIIARQPLYQGFFKLDTYTANMTVMMAPNRRLCVKILSVAML